MICTLAAVRGIEKTSNEFRAELCRMAIRLRTNPDFLSAVMSVESGFNPSIRNPLSGAVGLIQFIPSTAKLLGTTTTELAQLSAVEQLFYVEKYFLRFLGRLGNEQDAYLAVFCPAGAGRDSDFVLAKADSTDPSPCSSKVSMATVYKQNPGLDFNKDGIITNRDVGDVVRSILDEASGRPPIKIDVDVLIAKVPTKPPKRTNPILTLGASAGVGWILTRWWQKKS
jgi:hypothetical protein